jgi:DNA uptake protein ComE-like DNA-binding protein
MESQLLQKINKALSKHSYKNENSVEQLLVDVSAYQKQLEGHRDRSWDVNRHMIDTQLTKLMLRYEGHQMMNGEVPKLYKPSFDS